MPRLMHLAATAWARAQNANSPPPPALLIRAHHLALRRAAGPLRLKALLGPPELKALHPQGSAPVIQDSAVTLAESNAIVEYILTKYGRDQLQVAPDAPNYADYLYWLHFGNGTTLPGISRNMTFNFTGLPPSHPIGVRLEAMAQKLLQLLEDRVAQSTWLAGEEFTAADLLNAFGVTAMRLFWPFGLEKYPAILAWLKRVGEREAYTAAMENGDPGFTPLLGAGAPESVMEVSKRQIVE